MQQLLLPEICKSTLKLKYSNCNEYFYIDIKDKIIINDLTIRKDTNGYARTSKRIGDKIKHYSLQEILLKRKFDKKWHVIDHHDNNRNNYCRINLRESSYSENAFNRKSKPKVNNPSSKYIGVCRVIVKGHIYWQAAVKVNGKRIFIGSFKTEIEAAQARDKYMIKHFAEYALLNFPINIYL